MNAPIDVKKFRKLGLEPGEWVELLIDYPTRVRLKLKLIGYELGNYIILKSPADKIRNEYRDVLVEGNTVVGRYIIEGRKGISCGFKTGIRTVTKFPDHFVILNYPKRIHQKKLRKHQRIDVHMPVKISTADTTEGQKAQNILGIVVDITPLGCALELDMDDIHTDLNECFIQLELYNPQGELISIDAYVRNTRFEHDNVSLGVSFVDKNEQVEDMLKYLLVCTSM